ncbi:MAG: PilC/PilY family type IV pilus protein [Gammaproteobacteria bacterium]
MEKGGVAEVIRKGNNPPATNTTPTWSVNRKIYTVSGTTLTDFTTTSSGLSQNLVDYIDGMDVNNENNNYDSLGNPITTDTRPTLHGDSIHSRPMPIDYGGTTGVITYYGSNDGMFRAIDANDGHELWAFVAPEHFSKLQRLYDNSPLIYYPGMPAGITPTPTPKDYFFDGSFGVYQNADNSKVWIYPSMRRGGRVLYAFDVTNPTSPAFKWKVGCPNLADNTGCSTGMSGIGQTWSTPVVAKIKGYSTTSPVVIVGGGYDSCEDADTAGPSCGSATGAEVYVLDADTGSLIKTFTTQRSVVADISVLDMDHDGAVDVGYAVDTGGNIYRIDFTSGPSGNYAAQGSALWSMNRVAYTNGAGRKFLFAPALLPTGSGKVYLALGSGDREHPLITSYPYTTPVLNRFYVYLDDLTSTTANNLDDTNSFEDFSGTSSCSTSGVLPGSTSKGWFMDLNQYGTGEQVVTSAIIAGGMVTFSTNRPIPATAGSCANSLGQARGYWVNLINGSGAVGVEGSCGGALSTLFTGGGLPPSPVIGVVSINGAPTTVMLGAAQRDGSASGPVSPQRVKPTIKSRRKMIYWKFSGSQ